MNGKTAITFEVYKSENADIKRTARAVKKLIQEESGKRTVSGSMDSPEQQEARMGFIGTLKSVIGKKDDENRIYQYGPTQIIFSNDRSRCVQDSFEVVLTNGAIGLVLVMVVLTVFLNVRTAFWVAVGIPVSLLGAIFLLPFFDRFLDCISLASLILVIGIIVDGRFYGKIVSIFLRFRYPMVVFFFGVLLLSLWYAQNNMEFILFPSKGADSFFIGIELPTGTSLRSTSEKVKEIETIVESLPAEELGSFSTRIGTMGWVWEGEGEHHAFLLVNLTP